MRMKNKKSKRYSVSVFISGLLCILFLTTACKYQNNVKEFIEMEIAGGKSDDLVFYDIHDVGANGKTYVPSQKPITGTIPIENEYNLELSAQISYDKNKEILFEARPTVDTAASTPTEIKFTFQFEQDADVSTQHPVGQEVPVTVTLIKKLNGTVFATKKFTIRCNTKPEAPTIAYANDIFTITRSGDAIHQDTVSADCIIVAGSFTGKKTVAFAPDGTALVSVKDIALENHIDKLKKANGTRTIQVTTIDKAGLRSKDTETENGGHTYLTEVDFGCEFNDGVSKTLTFDPPNFSASVETYAGAPKLTVTTLGDGASFIYKNTSYDKTGIKFPIGLSGNTTQQILTFTVIAEDGDASRDYTVTVKKMTGVEISATDEKPWKKLKDTVADAAKPNVITINGAISATTDPDNNGEILIDRDITIVGKAGTDADTLDAAQLSRIFNVQAGKTLTIQNLTLTGGKTSGSENGGGIYTEGTITLDNCTIENCTTTGNGGGIYVAGGTFTIKGNSKVTVASDKNDVYLANGTTITLDGSLSSNPAARITPESYTAGTQVLDGTTMSDNYQKFTVTPNGSGNWEINSEGKLQKTMLIIGTDDTDRWNKLKTAVENANTGDIFLLEGTYKAPDGSDTITIEGTTLTVRANNSANPPTIDANGKHGIFTASMTCDVYLENLNLTGAKDENFALSGGQGASFNLKKVSISGCNKAISSDTSDVTLENCTVTQKAGGTDPVIKLGGGDNSMAGTGTAVFTDLQLSGTTAITGTIQCFASSNIDDYQGRIKILDDSSPAITISFTDYNAAENKQIVSVEGAGNLTVAVKNITVKDSPDNKKWKIAADGTLQKESGGTATTTVSSWTELKAAVENSSGTDTITINGTLTATAASDTIKVTRTVTIQGTDKASDILDAQRNCRIFKIVNGGALTLNNISLTNGKAGGDTDGGGIDNAGSLSLTNVMITNCKSENGRGGAVYNAGTLNLKNTVINNCMAPGYGGGICHVSGTAELDGATIEACSSEQSGGGIYNAGTLTLKNNTTIKKCEVTDLTGDGGGGICNIAGASATLDTVSIKSCEASELIGGGIANLGTLTVKNATIENCIAQKDSGGGIANSGTLTLTNTAISTCMAKTNAGHGGAIYTNDGTAKLTNVTINECTSDGNGGAIYCQNTNLEISGSGKISNCTAQSGGALYIRSANNKSVQLTGTASTMINISENKAHKAGGAVYFAGIASNFTFGISNCAFNQNSIEITDVTAGDVHYGGALYSASSLTLTDCTFEENYIGFASGVTSSNTEKKGATIYIADNSNSGNPVLCSLVGTLILDSEFKTDTTPETKLFGSGIFVGKNTALEIDGNSQVESKTNGTVQNRCDIYLTANDGAPYEILGKIKCTAGLGSEPIGQITPGKYQVGLSMFTNTSQIPASRFTVTDESNVSKWEVDTDGKLKKK